MQLKKGLNRIFLGYKTNDYDLKLHFDKKIVNKIYDNVKIYIVIQNEGCS